MARRNQFIDKPHHKSARRGIRIELGVPHHHHRITVRDVDKSHRPPGKTPRGDFLKLKQFYVFSDARR